jgi:methylglutamate dehydrogenase subunit B
MQIHCPYCGERDRSEFTYLGDASKSRPGGDTASAEDIFDYVYLRPNVAGPMDEFWYHGGGCHAWLIVTRHTVTHAISSVRIARDAVLDHKRLSPHVEES